MRRVGWAALAVALGLADPDRACGQARVLALGLFCADRVDTAALPTHMRLQHPLTLGIVDGGVMASLAAVGRFEVRRLPPPEEGGWPGGTADGVDYVVRVAVNKAQKVYTNEIIYRAEAALEGDPDGGGLGDGRPYEVLSLPTIAAQLEVVLEDPREDDILWSATRESTAVVPHDEWGFLYNSWKYPGLSHPDLVRAFLADVLRLQQANPWVDRSLNVADRWYVSRPDADLETARGVLRGLAASFAADLDANLPLEGRIQQVLAGTDGEVRAVLDLGERQGLEPRLRLDVWRPRPSPQKVGRVEVVSVDSTSAVARLRKLDRELKKRGEGLQVQDRVISTKRNTRRSSP